MPFGYRDRVPPYRPLIPDPDLPVGPQVFDPDDLFPDVRRPRFPAVNPPYDPFGSSEILPSRPLRPQGQPRQFPRGGGPSSYWFG